MLAEIWENENLFDFASMEVAVKVILDLSKIICAKFCP